MALLSMDRDRRAEVPTKKAPRRREAHRVIPSREAEGPSSCTCAGPLFEKRFVTAKKLAAAPAVFGSSSIIPHACG